MRPHSQLRVLSYTKTAMINPSLPQGNTQPQLQRARQVVPAGVKEPASFAPALRRHAGTTSTPGATTAHEARPQRIHRGAQEAAVFAYNLQSLKNGGQQSPIRKIDLYV